MCKRSTCGPCWSISSRIKGEILCGCKNATMAVADLVSQVNRSIVVCIRSNVVAESVMHRNSTVIRSQSGDGERIAINIADSTFQVCKSNIVNMIFCANHQTCIRHARRRIVDGGDVENSLDGIRQTTIVGDRQVQCTCRQRGKAAVAVLQRSNKCGNICIGSISVKQHFQIMSHSAIVRWSDCTDDRTCVGHRGAIETDYTSSGSVV